MRLDELPRSDNIEDRRGESSSSGGFSIPGGRGGLGIGPAMSRARTYRSGDQSEGLQNRKFDSTIIKE
jgi:hypothetical protein